MVHAVAWLHYKDLYNLGNNLFIFVEVNKQDARKQGRHKRVGMLRINILGGW